MHLIESVPTMQTRQIIGALLVLSVTVLRANAQPATLGAPVTSDQLAARAAAATVQAQEQAAAATRQRILAVRAALKAKFVATHYK
jgi:hypothetical protein